MKQAVIQKSEVVSQMPTLTKKQEPDIRIQVANSTHENHAESICEMIAKAAKIRGIGIAKREPEYIRQKMREGKAIIALSGEEVAGFCYIESWENQRFVANSGLIVHPNYRKLGLAKKIKIAIFQLSKKKFPQAKLFGITTSLAVMKINSDLGYKPVTFSELTQDEVFWQGCQSCPNYDILTRTKKKMCLCTAMIADLSKPVPVNSSNKISRWKRFVAFFEKRKIRLRKILEKYDIKYLNHYLNNRK